MIYSKVANQNSYPFILQDLPFRKEDFAPYFSTEAFDYHHAKHHQAYVTNLNNLLQNNTELQSKSLEEIIINNHGINQAIFNNAAQIWNHTFFWHSITPHSNNNAIDDDMLKQIQKDFGSFEQFVEEFKQAAITQFGSGWAWLVFADKQLQIVKTANADTPITQGMQPLLACDVWEHTYYIDYRNKRPDYVSTYMQNMINWKFVTENYRICL